MLKDRESEIAELKSTRISNEQCIHDLTSSVSNLQAMLDKVQNAVKQSYKLEQDLRSEIRQGESLRNRLEAERDQLHADLEKKSSDFEILLKSKEHSERHIAILVKEKDRIINKGDSKPSTTSKIYQIPAAEEKVTSWGQVENQRLKVLLEEEKKENIAKTEQIEKLQKENWNLINRFRNKKSIN